ncbi:MAG: DUF4279 domain-containing protein [Opitutaceae bacterium]|nr:DUF4279 domain-containing protein [Opitutaceae bacterium]
MTEEIIVRLKILSVTHTPDQITSLSGLRCDRSWLVGDKRGNTKIVEKCNGWILNSSLTKDASLVDHIENVLELAAPVAGKIRALSEHAEVELSCVIYSFSPPALNFESTIIERISSLGASLDIDLYQLEDPAMGGSPRVSS